jgi:hypothetical protein
MRLRRPNPHFFPFQMMSATIGGGMIAGLDVRTQPIIATPETLTIFDEPNSSATITITMDAIVDMGHTINIRLEDITQPDEDPDPTKDLSFDPSPEMDRR